MPLDPSIILAGQAPQIQTPQESILKRLTLQDAATRNQFNALKLQQLQKELGQTAVEDPRLKRILMKSGGDPSKVFGAMIEEGMYDEAVEYGKGYADYLKATKPTETSQPKIEAVETVDEQGNPVRKFVEPKAGDVYPMIPKSGTSERLPASAQEYEYAKAQGYPGTYQQYQNEDANRKRTVINTGNRSEPLVAVMGPDGVPVLVPRSQAAGKRPASSREQGRSVTSGDANRIADYDSSLRDLNVLTKTVGEVAGSTGTVAKIGAMTPNVITQLTGFGTTAKSKQAVIDRVKQVIGKALEGGVLRKEDEVKYEKILPTIGDVPAVVATKLKGLKAAIDQRRQTQLDALADAGYDVSRYEARAAPTSGAKRFEIISVK